MIPAEMIPAEMTRRMKPVRFSLAVVVAMFALRTEMVAQVAPSDADSQLKNALQLIEQLASHVAAQDERIAAQEARIKELEAGRGGGRAGAIEQTAATSPTAERTSADSATNLAPDQALQASSSQAPSGAASQGTNVPAAARAQTQDMSSPGHDMSLPFGLVLNIRGFFDFNFGVGSIANALVYPISDGGCGICGNPVTPAHTAFQAGEFDLLFASRISDHLNFLAEVVMGPAAESFLARQCQLALKTDAASITPPHFKELGSWVEVAACRFIEQAKALEMGKRIAALPAS